MRQALELLHICSWQVEFNTASVILLIGISLSWPESPVGEDSFSETECPGSGILCFLDFLFFFLALDPSLPNSFFDTLPLLCWRTKKTAELSLRQWMYCHVLILHMGHLLTCGTFWEGAYSRHGAYWGHGTFFFLRISRMCKTKLWCSLKRENSKNNKHTANIWGMHNNTLAMLSLKQNRAIIVIGKQLEWGWSWNIGEH